MDKKKAEILELFNEKFPHIPSGLGEEFLDLALTELWNTAIDEAEKAVGGEVCSYRDCSCQKETQEIRINLRKLKIRG